MEVLKLMMEGGVQASKRDFKGSMLIKEESVLPKVVVKLHTVLMLH